MASCRISWHLKKKQPGKHKVLHYVSLIVGGAEFFGGDHRKSSYPVDTCVCKN